MLVSNSFDLINILFVHRKGMFKNVKYQKSKFLFYVCMDE